MLPRGKISTLTPVISRLFLQLMIRLIFVASNEFFIRNRITVIVVKFNRSRPFCFYTFNLVLIHYHVLLLVVRQVVCSTLELGTSGS